MPTRHLALQLLAAAALVGPGGYAALAEDVPPLPPAVALQAPRPYAMDTGCSGTPPAASNADYEQQVISLVNQQRKANGLPPLKAVTPLVSAARWFAKDMAVDDYFNHDTYDRSGGSLVLACTWDARLSAFYSGWNSLGENIAAGYATPQDAVTGWMNSSGHRANILSSSYWETGVGYWTGGSYGRYWVQDFGRRSGQYPVVIDDEAASTDSRNVTLYVYGTWTEMRIRNDSESFGAWQPFSNTVAWTLANVNGLRTVTVEMRTGATTVSSSDTITLAQTSCEPNLALERATLAFGGVGTIRTSAQSDRLSILGAGTVPWTASSSHSFFAVTPTSGTGPATLTVSMKSGATSSASGTITVSSSAACNSPEETAVSYTQKAAGAGSAPFGNFDTPSHGTTGIQGSVAVTGWALDDVEVTKVEIYRDPVGGESGGAHGLVFVGNATFVPGARPDVESAYPGYPLAYRGGWGYMLLTNMLPGQGNGTFTLHAWAVDAEGHETLLGWKTITCANASATKPFGAIDTPAQGATVSGTAYVQFGWALTPQTASIPTNGSTITVYIDGVAVGHPVYNQYRTDIATLFPGFANSGGAVGYLVINTTTLANGLHTIAWSVTDSLGRSEGIGSRYFWVFN
jgi:uncharacterized protein YkwD